MAHLMMLFVVSHTLQYQVARLCVNNERERICNKVTVI